MAVLPVRKMPLYCQEQDFKQCGANLSRSTLANWIIGNADVFFRPMYDYFRRKLLGRQFVMADELCVAIHNSSYAKCFVMLSNY